MCQALLSPVLPHLPKLLVGWSKLLHPSEISSSVKTGSELDLAGLSDDYDRNHDNSSNDFLY